MISELGLKILRDEAADDNQMGKLCPLKPELLLELISLAEKSFQLDREADWLANQLGQDDNCPYIASGGDGFPDWCICIDSYEDGFYCDESMKECWRKAARKAVESSHEN